VRTQRPHPTGGAAPAETIADQLEASPRDDAKPEEATPPLGAHFEALDVAGYPPALVWVPPSNGKPLPLIVISHGAGGGPEWHCQFWSETIGDGAFLLCLAGLPLGNVDGHYFPDHKTLGKIWSASVAAFDAQFGARSTSESNVYVGYSQGATMGAWALPDHAPRFDRALLTEGGYREWNVQRALEFKRAGGRALHLVCGTASCFRHATSSVRWLQRADVDAELAYAHGAGHTPAGAVGEAARSALSWLLRQ
jgi:hypothetical protein